MSAYLEKGEVAIEVSNPAIREWLLRRAADKDAPIRRVAVPLLPLPTPSPSPHSDEVAASVAAEATSTTNSQSNSLKHSRKLSKGTPTSSKPQLHSQAVASKAISQSKYSTTSTTATSRKKRPCEGTPKSPQIKGQKTAKSSSSELLNDPGCASNQVPSNAVATDPMLDSTSLLWDAAAADAIKEWEASALASSDSAGIGTSEGADPIGESEISSPLTRELSIAIDSALELWRRYDKDGYLFLRGILGNDINEIHKKSSSSTQAAAFETTNYAAVATQVRSALAGHIARKHLRKNAGAEAPAAVTVKSKSLRGFTVESLTGEYIGSAARFKANSKSADHMSQAAWRDVGRGAALHQLIKGVEGTASTNTLMREEAVATNAYNECGSNHNGTNETRSRSGACKTDKPILSSDIEKGVTDALTTTKLAKNGGKISACEICCIVPDAKYGSGRFCSHVCLNRAKGKRHAAAISDNISSRTSNTASNNGSSSSKSLSDSRSNGHNGSSYCAPTRTSSLTLVLAQLALGASLVADADRRQRSVGNSYGKGKGNSKRSTSISSSSSRSESSCGSTASGSSEGGKSNSSDESSGYSNGPSGSTSFTRAHNFVHPHATPREARLEPLVFHPAYTWLRAKAPGERTVEHCDWYHFEDCSGFWTPSQAAAVAHLTALQSLDKPSSMQPPVDTSTATEAPATPQSTVATPRAGVASIGIEKDNRACMECGLGGSSDDQNDTNENIDNDDASMLLCDECSAPCHGPCATPPLSPEAIAILLTDPDALWFCRNCAPATSAPRPVFGSAWIPLEPVPRARGGLAVVPGSHQLPAFKHRTTQHGAPLPSSFGWPGPLEADSTPSSLAKSTTKSSTNAEKSTAAKTAAAAAAKTELRRWATSDYLPGDVVLFDLKTVHATGTNNNFPPRRLSPQDDKTITTSTGTKKVPNNTPTHDTTTSTTTNAASSLSNESAAAARAAADTFRLSVDTRWCLRPKYRPNWGNTPSSMFIEAAATLGCGDES